MHIRPTEFFPRASELYLRMIAQRGNKNETIHQIKKIF